MLKIGNIFFCLFFVGCTTHSIKFICPKYPMPSQVTLNTLLDSKNKDSIEWLIKQKKLKEKLEICNE